MIELNRFYTRRQACELLAVSAKALCSAVRAGRLRASKVGSTDLYKGEWLISWIESSAKHEASTRRSSEIESQVIWSVDADATSESILNTIQEVNKHDPHNDDAA